MPEAKRDENDRLRDGTLPQNPGDDAIPIPISSHARRIAESLVPSTGSEPPPPSDLAAETALLGVILWCGTYAAGSITPGRVADLLDRDDMFYVPAHRVIWGAARELHARGAPCDATAIHSELVREHRDRVGGAMEYLEQLVAGAQPATEMKVREYAEAIRETWMRRQLMDAAEDLRKQARAARGFASDIAGTFAARLSEAAGRGARDASYVHIATPLEATLNRAQEPQKDKPLTTGIPELNKLLFGGFRRREVTVVAARTSVGKSALGLDMAIAGHEDQPDVAVLYTSLEMSAEEFSVRMVSSRAKVETETILKGVATQAELERMYEVGRKIRTQEIYFNVRQNLSLAQIRGVATKVAREVTAKGKRLGLIVIDHIGLVRPTTRKPSREQEVAEVSRELRAIANDFDAHVMGLAQISREAEKQTGKDKVPQLHHLRESGAIEQDTNNVLILHRERGKDGLFIPNKPAILNVAKARNARTGRVWLAVEPKFVRFSPWESSDQSKAHAPVTPRSGDPSRQYIDPAPEPPPGRFDDDDGNPLMDGL